MRTHIIMKTIVTGLFLTVIGLQMALADPADPTDHNSWKVTANDYQYSMTITTALVFNMEESRDVKDKIAAFVGDDCRGVAQPITYVPEYDRYLAHVLVYSNQVNGESITLYMYDHSEEKIVEVAQTLDFAVNATYGSTSDPYLSHTTYDITFKVEAAEGMVANAEVTLDGYGTKYTDDQGKVTYFDVEPTENIIYNVFSEGYDAYQNTVSVIDSDIEETVYLSLFSVIFEVTDGQRPVDNASIVLQGYDLKHTDVYGFCEIPLIILTDDQKYTVDADGYYPISKSFEVVDHDITIKVTLTKKTYNLSFEINDDAGSVANAEVTLTANKPDLITEFTSGSLPQDMQSKGNAHWAMDNQNTYQGQYAAQSGVIFDNQSSKLMLEKTTRHGYISFYRKVSSEEENDYLSFLVDGEERGRWSGEHDWKLLTYEIEPGDHIFEWVYEKDGSNAEGQDCAWIDYVVIPSADSIVYTEISNNMGVAEIFNLQSLGRVIYSIHSENHIYYYDTINYLQDDHNLLIELDRVYDLSFTVYSDSTGGNNLLSDAIVTLTDKPREAMTGLNGKVTFDRVAVSDSIPFTVSLDGYEKYSGITSVVDDHFNQEVILAMQPMLDAANILTPNGDGINDHWELFNEDRYKSFTVFIYSSSGELLFETDNYLENKWDGKVGSRNLPDGVYYYILKSPDRNMVFKGIINLIN